jgi:hypothetical protein
LKNNSTHLLFQLSPLSPKQDQDPWQFQRNCWIPILTIWGGRYIELPRK